MWQIVIGLVGQNYGIAATMVWCGVPLYCVGRLLEAGPFTLIGFEKTEPSDMVVKGPDETHTVWIGRTYASAFEAEANAVKFRSRLTPQKGMS